MFVALGLEGANNLKGSSLNVLGTPNFKKRRMLNDSDSIKGTEKGNERREDKEIKEIKEANFPLPTILLQGRSAEAAIGDFLVSIEVETPASSPVVFQDFLLANSIDGGGWNLREFLHRQGGKVNATFDEDAKRFKRHFASEGKNNDKQGKSRGSYKNFD